MRTEAVKIGDAMLYLGDCRDMFGEFVGVVNCIVSDPPYGIAHPCNFKSRGRGLKAGSRVNGKVVWNAPHSNDYPDVHGDREPFDPAPILALDVPTVLWGGNHYADKLPPSGGWLVWDKERPDDLDQATCELAWTNCVKGLRRFRHLWNGMMRASEHGENYHPTQKPVALFAWIFSLPWIPQGVVIDPYMGSGPSIIAALRSGRRAIGIEISPQYFDIACKRIQAELDRSALFTGLEDVAPVQQNLLDELETA